MTDRRRWWWRLGAVVVGVVGVEVVIAVIDGQADELRLVLVVALVVVAASLLLDVAQVGPAAWSTYVERESGLSRLDPRTSSYVRILEGHLSAREPDPALWGRLRWLADHTLRARHDVPLDDPRAAELVGPELMRVLTDVPRRMEPAEIERCVRRIEEL